MALLDTGYIFLESYTSYSSSTSAWSNLSNLGNDDRGAGSGLPRTTPTNVDGTSNYAVGNQVGSALPVGSYIRGIEVQIDRQASIDDSRYIRDNVITLFINAVPSGDNKSASAQWTVAWATPTFGNSTDLWGLSGNWHESVLRDSGFGIGLRINRNTQGGSDINGYCNYIRMKVHYNPTGIFMGM